MSYYLSSKLLLYINLQCLIVLKVVTCSSWMILQNVMKQRSVIVTSNLEFGQWNRVFGDNRLTAALVDRLVHHAHILAFTGESYRLKNALPNVTISTTS